MRDVTTDYHSKNFLSNSVPLLSHQPWSALSICYLFSLMVIAIPFFKKMATDN